MFLHHQPMIAAHASTPEGFVDVVTFVIATVNQRFFRVGEIVDLIHTEGYSRCKYLTAVQKRGIAYAIENKRTLHHALIGDKPTACTLFDRFVTVLGIPGLGIIKGGFLLQCLRGESGCLDTRNCRTYGLDIKVLGRIPASTEGLRQKLELYHHTLDLIGPCDLIWDTWCYGLAKDYPQFFTDAEDVSNKHVLWSRSA